MSASANAHAFALWGDPVGHSRSPAMHQAAFRAMGLPHSYGARRVAPELLGRSFQTLAIDGLSGVNLTVPHKRAALAHVDTLTAEARRIGAINAVRVDEGGLIGHNTDGLGFMAALAELPGVEIEHAVVLGSGGASLAVVDALLAQPTLLRLSWVSRGPEGIDHPLAGDPRIEPRGYGWLQSLGSATPGERAQLLVNTTTVGMAHGPRQFPVEIEFSWLDAGSRVVDLVYPAMDGGLTDRAAQLEFAAVDGLPMLLWQGVHSLEFWLEQPVAAEIVDAMRRALGLPVR